MRAARLTALALIACSLVGWLSAPAARADDGKKKPAGLTEEQRRKNLASFDQVWETIRDKHYDPKLGGLDWQKVREEYRPRVEKADSTGKARAALREMLGRLGQSHFAIIPAEVYDDIKKGSGEGDKKAGGAKKGGPGFDLRVAGGQVLVVRVRPGTPAAKLGVAPGWVVRKIKGEDPGPSLEKIRKAFKDSPRLEMEQAVALAGRYAGKPGEEVEFTFLDGADKERTLKVPLIQPAGTPARLGHLPTIYVDYRAHKVGGDVGYFSLNAFMDPEKIIPAFEKTVRDNEKSAGLVIDLRGNPGGIGAMAMGLAGWLVAEDTHKLGTMSMRNSKLHFVVNPREATFAGPVAVLVDGLSGSTSEIFAGGLQDLKRARVFGTRTAGAALPSIFVRLPNGDGFQYAFANYVSVGGKVLEGRGVIPDETVAPDRKSLLEGRDPALDAAVRWIRTRQKK